MQFWEPGGPQAFHRLFARARATFATTLVSAPLTPPLKFRAVLRRCVYRARDEIENEGWLEDLEAAAERLEYDGEARSRAVDLFLSNVPEDDRSKQAVLAASLYVAGLVSGQRRTQSEVAEAADVTRLTVQQRWKPILESAGLDAPEW
jgi:transcription initiation factor TFIIIB Brf1 subunit/transcription initiation factor TFIIB